MEVRASLTLIEIASRANAGQRDISAVYTVFRARRTGNHLAHQNFAQAIKISWENEVDQFQPEHQAID